MMKVLLLQRKDSHVSKNENRRGERKGWREMEREEERERGREKNRARQRHREIGERRERGGIYRLKLSQIFGYSQDFFFSWGTHLCCQSINLKSSSKPQD